MSTNKFKNLFGVKTIGLDFSIFRPNFTKFGDTDNLILIIINLFLLQFQRYFIELISHSAVSLTNSVFAVQVFLT